MLIEKRAAGFSLLLLLLSASGWSAPRFSLSPTSQGGVRAFRAIDVPLSEFVREYARVTSTQITTEDSWDGFLKGSVTLLLRKDQSKENLTEILHRVLADNGFAVVDAPAGNGWVIAKQRDARDLSLPVHELKNLPDSARLVTASHTLAHAEAEDVARTMRSFMPANSRIIPVGHRLLFITDTATNIRRLGTIISRMDSEESAKRAEAERNRRPPPQKTCGEQRIASLVVEKLEIRDTGEGNPPFSLEAPNRSKPPGATPPAPRKGPGK